MRSVGYRLSTSQSVILSFYVQDYCKRNQPISLKLGVMVGPTNGMNWLTFGGDPVLDTDSGSVFHFSHHCRIEDFRTFVNY